MAALWEARDICSQWRQPRTRLFEPPRRTPVLQNVTVTVEHNRSVGIIGESGSGKSTLLRAMLGLHTPSSGEVLFDGHRVDPGAPARSLHWLRRETGMVFQNPSASLDPRMTAAQIIAEPLDALRITGDRDAAVSDALAAVQLEPEMAYRYPHEFSGGQRQRIALARAIVHRPRVLVGDEPFSALDVITSADILALISQWQTQGLTLVIVSHDLGVVQQLCAETIVLHDGVVVENAPTAEVFSRPRHEHTQRLIASAPRL